MIVYLQNLMEYKYYLLLVFVWLICISYNLITIKHIISLLSFIVILLKKNKIFINIIEKINYKYIIYLLNIGIWINPFLYLLYVTNVKIMKVIFQINENVKNKKIRLLCKCMLFNITTPFKLFLFKYYNIIKDWIKQPYYVLIFKRLYGTIITILFFTNIIQFVLSLIKLGGWILFLKFFIYIYLVIYVINIIITYIYFKNIEQKERVENIKNAFNKYLFFSIYNLYQTRSITLLNTLIISIVSLWLHITKSEKELLFYFPPKGPTTAPTFYVNTEG